VGQCAPDRNPSRALALQYHAGKACTDNSARSSTEREALSLRPPVGGREVSRVGTAIIRAHLPARCRRCARAYIDRNRRVEPVWVAKVGTISTPLASIGSGSERRPGSTLAARDTGSPLRRSSNITPAHDDRLAQRCFIRNEVYEPLVTMHDGDCRGRKMHLRTGGQKACRTGARIDAGSRSCRAKGCDWRSPRRDAWGFLLSRA
jgi:hypothetical protein